ncbi:hypothetical protein AGABI1DRAFT_131336 [Agaricus bisporus var. burnettii JB137-S8]|uniref:Uncharacterized protein n=1 Tax=Agaricus bisporus var. burnettii (strain JB137-S8 / ATCC MYA-4627 / FGSC 10392) TaxID=597362 RepID=K5XP94_AGABU|nr:uncharacterized protein AGABI1DRAFT_131336 [Agaricus bisporus var. burnettii JB137-S8]EKM76515.1 hypothetical protein AGABI1DRAFT_131336 [Agaricus bisporus var. burnettii JB137-S8]
MPSTNNTHISIFSLKHYHVYDKKLTEVFTSAAKRLSITAAATIDIVTAGETDWTSNIPKINMEQQSDFSDGRGVGILDAMTFKNKRNVPTSHGESMSPVGEAATAALRAKTETTERANLEYIFEWGGSNTTVKDAVQ